MNAGKLDFLLWMLRLPTQPPLGTIMLAITDAAGPTDAERAATRRTFEILRAWANDTRPQAVAAYEPSEWIGFHGDRFY